MTPFYKSYYLPKYHYCMECAGEILEERQYPHHRLCYKKYKLGKLNSKCQNKFKKCNNLKKSDMYGKDIYGLCPECYDLVMTLNHDMSKGHLNIEVLKKLVGKE